MGRTFLGHCDVWLCSVPASMVVVVNREVLDIATIPAENLRLYLNANQRALFTDSIWHSSRNVSYLHVGIASWTCLSLIVSSDFCFQYCFQFLHLRSIFCISEASSEAPKHLQLGIKLIPGSRVNGPSHALATRLSSAVIVPLIPSRGAEMLLHHALKPMGMARSISVIPL